MTLEELRQLSVGDKVRHEDGTEGVVSDKGYSCLTIAWKDKIFSQYLLNADPLRAAGIARA